MSVPQSCTGKLVKYDKQRGFGFIRPIPGQAVTGKDVFLHVVEMADQEQISALRVGVILLYAHVDGDRGPKALNVRVQQPAGSDEECDVLSVEEYGREVVRILDNASVELQGLARKHGWVE